MDNDNKLSFILNNVKFNITTINFFKNHFETLLSSNFIFLNKYENLMDKIKFLNTESNIQLKLLLTLEHFFNDNMINEETTNKINILETNLYIISEQIKKIVQEYGYISIHKILNIIDKSLYEKHKINLFYKIDILENFFQPVNIKKLTIPFIENIKSASFLSFILIYPPLIYQSFHKLYFQFL